MTLNSMGSGDNSESYGNLVSRLTVFVYCVSRVRRMKEDSRHCSLDSLASDDRPSGNSCQGPEQLRKDLRLRTQVERTTGTRAEQEKGKRANGEARRASSGTVYT